MEISLQSKILFITNVSEAPPAISLLSRAIPHYAPALLFMTISFEKFSSFLGWRAPHATKSRLLEEHKTFTEITGFELLYFLSSELKYTITFIFHRSAHK